MAGLSLHPNSLASHFGLSLWPEPGLCSQWGHEAGLLNANCWEWKQCFLHGFSDRKGMLPLTRMGNEISTKALNACSGAFWQFLMSHWGTQPHPTT